MTSVKGTVRLMSCPHCFKMLKELILLEGLTKCPYCFVGLELSKFELRPVGSVRLVPGEGLRPVLDRGREVSGQVSGRSCSTQTEGKTKIVVRSRYPEQLLPNRQSNLIVGHKAKE